MTNDSPENRSWIDKVRELLLNEPQTKQQLLELINQAEQRELIDKDAYNMIEGVISVSEKQVRDVMVPRPQMVIVAGDKTAREVLPIITQSGHSRFPVIGDTPDKIIGILLAKDLLKVINDAGKHNFRVHRLIRPTTFVPESKPLDTLLKEFRQKRNHLAVVIDEYGETSGLITIEDVLEEIVGEIDDEYDCSEDRKFIREHTSGEYILRALTPIDDFNNFFSATFPHNDFDTVGGLLLKEFNHVPTRGEQIELQGFVFTVVDATNRGIVELKVRKI